MKQLMIQNTQILQNSACICSTPTSLGPCAGWRPYITFCMAVAYNIMWSMCTTEEKFEPRRTRNGVEPKSNLDFMQYSNAIKRILLHKLDACQVIFISKDKSFQIPEHLVRYTTEVPSYRDDGVILQ